MEAQARTLIHGYRRSDCSDALLACCAVADSLRTQSDNVPPPVVSGGDHHDVSLRTSEFAMVVRARLPARIEL